MGAWVWPLVSVLKSVIQTVEEVFDAVIIQVEVVLAHPELAHDRKFAPWTCNPLGNVLVRDDVHVVEEAENC